jgi:hypothetical protein
MDAQQPTTGVRWAVDPVDVLIVTAAAGEIRRRLAAQRPDADPPVVQATDLLARLDAG